MPYGIAKKVGGDNPANTAKMERCVEKVMAQGHNKLRSVLICKASIQGTTNRSKSARDAVVRSLTRSSGSTR